MHWALALHRICGKFAKNYSMTLLGGNDQKLFLKYWNKHILYKENCSFMDPIVKSLVENKYIFTLFSRAYLLVKNTKKILTF